MDSEERIASSATSLFKSKQMKKTFLRNPTSSRYLYGRLTRCQFITVAIIFVQIILLIIISPIIHQIIIPNMIRNRVRSLISDDVTVYRFNLGTFKDNNFNASFHANLAPTIYLPITPIIKPFVIKAFLLDKNQTFHEVIEINHPILPLNLKDTDLEAEITGTFDSTDKTYFQDFLKVQLLNFNLIPETLITRRCRTIHSCN